MTIKSSGSFPRLREWTRDDPTHPFHPDQASLFGIPASWEVIIDDLESAAPQGLLNRRSTFRSQMHNIEALLNLRSELVIASSLARNHVEFVFASDSPDMICQARFGTIGVEATTRVRDDLAELHDRLEERLANGPDVTATISRAKELFKFDQSRQDELLDAVEEAISETRTQPVAVAGVDVRIQLQYGLGSLPNHRVTWSPVLEETTFWQGASREITGTIRKKGEKTYAVPTIAAVDVTRLGDMFHWILFPPSEEELTQHLEPKLLGSLEGVALVIAGNLQSAGMMVLTSYSNPAANDGAQVLDWFREATKLSPSLRDQ